MGNEILGNPKFAAANAYRNGEGHDANPYLKGSPQFSEWAWEMHRLQSEEFHQLMRGHG